MGQCELEDEVVLSEKPAGEAPGPPQGEEGASNGGRLLSHQDRKDVAAVHWALLVDSVAVLVEQVTAGEENREDVGRPQLGGIREKLREEEMGREAVLVAGGA